MLSISQVQTIRLPNPEVRPPRRRIQEHYMTSGAIGHGADLPAEGGKACAPFRHGQDMRNKVWYIFRRDGGCRWQPIFRPMTMNGSCQPHPGHSMQTHPHAPLSPDLSSSDRPPDATQGMFHTQTMYKADICRQLRFSDMKHFLRSYEHCKEYRFSPQMHGWMNQMTQQGYDNEVAELKIECDCRKPKPGMLLRAAEDFNVDLSKSYMVGDSENDIKSGIEAGCKTVLLKGKDTEGKCDDFGQSDTLNTLAEFVAKYL